MNGNPSAREPEIHREQDGLNERIMTLDKISEELRSELGQMEQVLRIALRPHQDNQKTSAETQPDPPPPVTQLGDAFRRHANAIYRIGRQIHESIERLRDIRDRCELPRLPEIAQAMTLNTSVNADRAKVEILKSSTLG